MKNILFISNYFKLFDGLDSGASNRSTMFIAALTKIGHVDVVSFRGGDKSNMDNCTVVYDNEIGNSSKGKRFDKFLQLFAFHSPNKIYTPNNEKIQIVHTLLKNKNYDYIACRYMREAVECGLLEYSDKLILDVDDNPKDVVLMSARTARTLRNRLYNRVFAFTLDAMVKYVLKDVFCCFHSNPLQAPIEKSVYLHNVSVSESVIGDVKTSTPMQILVVGLFHYGPNKDGVDHFLQYVWPIVNNANSDIVLHIVGKIPDERIKLVWEKYQNVQVMGFVPDLEEEYRNARIAIVPIYEGSGTSVKVVEAMNLNRLCVSTPQGVRGYEKYMHADEDYLLADSDEAFANHITKCITDVDRCNTIAHSAKKKINQYFSREHFCNIVCETIKNKKHE